MNKHRSAKQFARLQRRAYTSDAARQMLTLQARLEESQWWSATRIVQFQEDQLLALLDHARRVVPYYGTTLDRIGLQSGAPFDWARWRLRGLRSIAIGNVQC